MGSYILTTHFFTTYFQFYSSLNGYSIISSKYVSKKGVVNGEEFDLVFEDENIKPTDIPMVTKYVEGTNGNYFSERTFIYDGRVTVSTYSTRTATNVIVCYCIVVLRK